MKKPTSTSAAWDTPEPTAEFLLKHMPEDIHIWQTLRSRVVEVAKQNGWTKSEVARRTGIADSTFSQWTSGKYEGVLPNQNLTVSQWLDAVEVNAQMAASVPRSPKFIMTKVAFDIVDALSWTQVTAGFVMVTLGAGVGKTTACRNFRDTRPHVYLATISPSTKTTHGMLVELAEEIGVQEHNPAKLVRAIGAKLKRIGDGTLLIVDEAQNLLPEAVNQLRHFSDVYECGVALVGNEEIATQLDTRKASSSKGQVSSRFDKRVMKERSRADDISDFLAAWNIKDEDCITFLTGIGMKAGALRQIDKTIKLALMLSNGMGEQLALKHVKKAWENRDVGGLL
ncbi:AAA family ATPase [Rhizobium sp. CFBP 8762]|uniref:AAA family ATPase n=1 Tax=Rhizobium sp. CFBP 8762 TaxID=2775279 RepID=UPI00177AC090|nr:AAA family ATPase [Rhizobium sp. CFBP 8762]MBD8554887.1 AAA family ATPase [Rhizobium sp. CFBP 8762]